MSHIYRGPSKVVVGAGIAIVLFYFAFKIFGLYGGILWTLIGLYEGWTLINNYPNDTITETIQGFAARTAMVPFIFACGTMYYMCGCTPPSGVKAVGAGILLFLNAHFFFGNKLRKQ